MNTAEFQAVRTTYPVGESLYCHVRFNALSSCQPETGDWIGIYKAGWMDMRDYVCKKYVTESDIWGEVERYVQVCFQGTHRTHTQITEQPFSHIHFSQISNCKLRFLLDLFSGALAQEH